MSQTFSSSAITIVATGVQILTGVSSASATIPVCSSGEYPRYIRIAASQPACVRIGTTAATATTNDMQVQPGDAVILQLPNGYTKIAAIQATVGGIVQISPLENM